MPIYEYACERCQGEFEVEQRITDDPLKRCPSCRSSKIKRLISQTSFVLKGGGWYSDLYSSSRKDGKPSAGDGADGGKRADAKEASTSTEKKKPKSESNKKDKGAQAAA